jgi:host cell surface-exposed lipoprotein
VDGVNFANWLGSAAEFDHQRRDRHGCTKSPVEERTRRPDRSEAGALMSLGSVPIDRQGARDVPLPRLGIPPELPSHQRLTNPNRSNTMKKFLATAIVVLAALSLASSAQASTAGQRNALSSAQSYLRYSAFSKSGLLGQLRYEHYSRSNARWAVNHVRANWWRQAVKKAKSYLQYSSFSRQSLIEQLEYEGFTHSQARYGVNNAYH